MADTTSTRSRGFAERSVFWMILVTGVAAALLIAVVIAATSPGEEEDYETGAGASTEQVPTGAGTNPDGVADTTSEGIEDSTTDEEAAEIVEPAADDAGGEVADEPAATDETNETAQDVVDDPDNGQPNEPDGGAEEFTPTPAGPEGSDDNPLTLD